MERPGAPSQEPWLEKDPDNDRSGVLALVVLVACAIALGALTLLHTLGISGDHPVRSLLCLVPVVALSLAGISLLAWAYWRIRLEFHAPGDRAQRLVVLLSLPTILITIEAFAAVTTLLWERGLLRAPAAAEPSLWAVERQYAWTLMHAIPALDITGTLDWRPVVTFSDRLSGALFLLFKMLLIAPVIGVAAGAYRLFQHRQMRRVQDEHANAEFADDRLQTFGDLLEQVPGMLRNWLWLLLYPLLAYVILKLLSAPDSAILNGLAIAGILVLTAVRVFGGLLPLSWGITYAGRSLSLSATLLFRRVLAFIMVVLLLCAVTVCLLHLGVARITPTPPRGEQVSATTGWYASHLAETIPFLEVPRTLNWSHEFEFVDSTSRAFMLFLKVNLVFLLFMPLALLVRLYVETNPAYGMGETLPLLEQFLNHLEGELGATHPMTLAARADLGSAYAVAGRTDDAIVALERLVSDSTTAFGAGHPDTQQARAYLESLREAASRS